MCRLSFGEIDKVEICDFELTRDEVSYTYKTVEHFLSLNPDEKICICVGADCLESLEHWANADYLFKNCVFAAAYRYRDLNQSFDEAIERLKIKYNAWVIPLCYDIIEMSSTEIRNELKNAGDRILHGSDRDNVLNNIFEHTSFVESSVLEYIFKKKLYGVGESHENDRKK
jgi:nicotinate-nucleotide adenylyltransferase